MKFVANVLQDQISIIPGQAEDEYHSEKLEYATLPIS